MSNDLRELLSERIFIPSSLRDRATAELYISIRLWNVLRRLGFQKLGDLNDVAYRDIFTVKNCGHNTIFELRDCIEELLAAEGFQSEINPSTIAMTEERKKSPTETIYIPQEVRGLPLSSFTFSTRLTNILQNFDFRLLGDLQGIFYDDFRQLENCGNKTIVELKEFIGKIQTNNFENVASILQVDATATDFNLNKFVNFTEDFLEKFPERDRNILGLRLGRNKEKPLKLEEIGERYKLTRERIRQIENRIIKKLDSHLGQQGKKLFEQLAHNCVAAICPLTPQLLVHWTKEIKWDFRFTPAFYVRLLSRLAPEIPILPEGQIEQGSPRTEQASVICQQIKSILTQCYNAVPLNEMFQQLKSSMANLQEKEFLDALQFSNYLSLTFDSPDKPSIKLTAKRKVLDAAYQILSESEYPLTPDEIVKRAKEKFGEELIAFSPYSVANIPLYEKGFYLLDRRTIGLRKHFRLPPERWSKLCDDFYNLLKEHQRPFSTTEVIADRIFDWTDDTNASEAAQILREDNRFTDLRRFHFALADWDIKERGYLRDLVVQLLEQAGHPLTATEIHNQLQKIRSVAATSLPTILSQSDNLKSYGFGFYGLKSWGGEADEFLLSNRDFINRLISRSEPPLTFGDLCRKLEITENGFCADRLWRTLRALPKVRFKPNNQTLETILVHTNWRFERAIQKILSQAERPLSVYEIQWELNRIFGATFDDKKLDAIKNCLQNNEIFVRNPQGEFLLNEQIDRAEIGADWLRFACFEILREDGAALSADDLLEKLEAEDLASEGVSAEMLAAILRGDAGFEEIGRNLFRTKK